MSESKRNEFRDKVKAAHDAIDEYAEDRLSGKGEWFERGLDEKVRTALDHLLAFGTERRPVTDEERARLERCAELIACGVADDDPEQVMHHDQGCPAKGLIGCSPIIGDGHYCQHHPDDPAHGSDCYVLTCICEGMGGQDVCPYGCDV